MSTLLLSPHCDDIALSCGGLLLKAELPGPLILVTAFSASNYAPVLKKPPGRDVVSSIRLTEDNSFCERIGAICLPLGLPDAKLCYDSGGPPSNRDSLMRQAGGLYSILSVKLEQIILALKKVGQVIAPLGLGKHIDHLLLSEVAAHLASSMDINVAFYEDLPYAADFSFMQIQKRALQINLRAAAKLYRIDDVFEEKVGLIELYASQYVSLYTKAARRHSMRVGKAWGGLGERLWL